MVADPLAGGRTIQLLRTSTLAGAHELFSLTIRRQIGSYQALAE